MTDEQQSDSLLEQRFHGYRIEKRLAEGGMGAVYLLRHIELPGILKVLKVAHPELLAMPDPSARESVRQRAELFRASNMERFEQEALAISQLEHPNIATIDGIDTIDGRRCILMPFLRGKPLDQVLADHGGKLPPHYVLHIALQIAHALAHVHSLGIVHRDLKPSNVFIVPIKGDPFALKVIDFGIAKLAGTNPATKTLNTPLGTPYFMGVEQWENPAAAKPTADVFSLAVMIYLMLTGRYPWGEHDNTYVIYTRQREEPPDPAPPDTMPPGWEAWLRTALAPDPGQRPQSMPALMRPLALALAAIPPAYPSGVEMLQSSIASEWLDESGPTDAAGRNPVDSAPSRSQPGAISLVTLPPLHVNTPSPADPIPTMNERGRSRAAPSASQPNPAAAASGEAAATATASHTTLGSAAGVMSISARRSWRLALIGMGTAALVGLCVFGVAATLRRPPTQDAAVSSQPRAPSTPASAPTLPSPTVAPTAREPLHHAAAIDRPSAPLTADAGVAQPTAPIADAEAAPHRPTPPHAPARSMRPPTNTGHVLPPAKLPTTDRLAPQPPIENPPVPPRTSAPAPTPSRTDDDDIDPNDVGGRTGKTR